MKLAVGAAAIALAALSTQAEARQSQAPKWEVETFLGASFGRFESGGKIVVPDPGAPIVTSSPIFPSWRVPSWFFGDGAAFLNNVATEFGIGSRITPIDALLRPRGLNDAGLAHAGVRVRRILAPQYALEIGVEFATTSLGLSDTFTDGLVASAASFNATFTELLSTGPFTSPVVSAGMSAQAGSSREVALTAAVLGDGRAFGKFTPYVVLGGGVVAQTGSLPSAAVTGRYRFQIAGSAPIDQTDMVVVAYEQKTQFVLVAGGGVRRDFSPRWGIRVDARVLMGPDTVRVTLGAAPSTVTATPAGFIESFTYPNLQFSNNPSTGRVSTLSGPGVTGFEAFTGGWLTRGRVTGGVFWKF